MNGVGVAPPMAPPQPVAVSTPYFGAPHTNASQPQMMTTAAFAQTKFGSTKVTLKNFENVKNKE